MKFFGRLKKQKTKTKPFIQAGSEWKADIHTSVGAADAVGVIYAQPGGGRERWVSEGPALIGDLVWLCPFPRAHARTHTHTVL